MKKKISLTKLANNELKKAEMKQLVGGSKCFCLCACRCSESWWANATWSVLVEPMCDFLYVAHVP